jgi:transposase
MPAPYSLDLRERVVEAVAMGASCREAAARFRVSVSTVVKWAQRWRSTGSVAAKAMGGDNSSRLRGDDAAWVLGLVASEPDLTIEEIRERLRERGISVGYATVCGGSWTATLSGSKKTLHASEQDRPDVAAARQRWREARATLDPARLVFIDETWAKTNMTRTHGRCRRGVRLKAKVPHGRWRTNTFLAALRQDGIEAPFVLEGAIDRPCFEAYVEQCLAPTLRPGDIVVMDNLASRECVRNAIAAKGASPLFLPPYSPDLSPIELMFAKLKALLRKAAQRTVDDLWNCLGQALECFSPDECRAFFRHAGYP